MITLTQQLGYEAPSTPQVDPFQPAAAVAAAVASNERRAATTAAIPAPPAPKPSTWDRLTILFGRRRENAREVYLRLLRKSELDGRELNDRELVELADAMQLAKISEDDAAGHRAIIRRAARSAAAAKRVGALQSESAECKRQIEIIRDEIRALQERARPLHDRQDAAEDNLRVSKAESGSAVGDAEQVAQLFGE